MKSPRALIVALLLTLPGFALAATAPAPKPLRILLITGGCCHDYATQKDLLKQGLEDRAHVVVEHMHTADKTTRPSFPAHTNPHYADGYDLVIHDECAADIADPAMVQNVLAPHLAGIPGGAELRAELNRMPGRQQCLDRVAAAAEALTPQAA